MKKILLLAAIASTLLFSAASAQPQAREIAFAQSCDKGVHVFDKQNNAVTCGKPQASGSGYVIQMATDGNGNVQCPRGYNYIGHIQGAVSDGLQHFACAKL